MLVTHFLKILSLLTPQSLGLHSILSQAECWLVRFPKPTCYSWGTWLDVDCWFASTGMIQTGPALLFAVLIIVIDYCHCHCHRLSFSFIITIVIIKISINYQLQKKRVSAPWSFCKLATLSRSLSASQSVSSPIHQLMLNNGSIIINAWQQCTVHCSGVPEPIS